MSCTVALPEASSVARRSSVGESRWQWLPVTTMSDPFAWAAIPPGQNGPLGRGSERRTAVNVSGSSRSTQPTTGSSSGLFPSVCLNA